MDDREWKKLSDEDKLEWLREQVIRLQRELERIVSTMAGDMGKFEQRLKALERAALERELNSPPTGFRPT